MTGSRKEKNPRVRIGAKLLAFGIAAVMAISCDLFASKADTGRNEFEKYGIYPGKYLQTLPVPADSLIRILYTIAKDTMTLSVHNSVDDCTRAENIVHFKVSSDSICFDSGRYRYALSGSCLQPSDTFTPWPSSCTMLRNAGSGGFEIFQHEETIAGPGGSWAKLVRR